MHTPPASAAPGTTAVSSVRKWKKLELKMKEENQRGCGAVETLTDVEKRPLQGFFCFLISSEKSCNQQIAELRIKKEKKWGWRDGRLEQEDEPSWKVIPAGIRFSSA